jgi:hypothetical protein
MRDLLCDHGHIGAMSGPLMLTAVYETGTRHPGTRTTLASSLGSFNKPRETGDHQPFGAERTWHGGNRAVRLVRRRGARRPSVHRHTPPLASCGSGSGACPSSRVLPPKARTHGFRVSGAAAVTR